LSLFADMKAHSDIIRSLESIIQDLGTKLIPDLGVRPLDPSFSSRPEVLEFVGVLSSLDLHGNFSKRVPDTCPADAWGDTTSVRSIGTSTRGLAPVRRCQASQTVGEFLVRFAADEISGLWEPLDDGTIRQGAIVRCTTEVRSNTEGTYNFLFSPNQMAKVVGIDADGDAKVCALEETQILNLWQPSECRWLLRDSFYAFRVWRPSSAIAEAGQLVRNSRADKNTHDD